MLNEQDFCVKKLAYCAVQERKVIISWPIVQER
jgi:hypothetical protein